MLMGLHLTTLQHEGDLQPRNPYNDEHWAFPPTIILRTLSDEADVIVRVNSTATVLGAQVLFASRATWTLLIQVLRSCTVRNTCTLLRVHAYLLHSVYCWHRRVYIRSLENAEETSLHLLMHVVTPALVLVCCRRGHVMHCAVGAAVYRLVLIPSFSSIFARFCKASLQGSAGAQEYGGAGNAC